MTRAKCGARTASGGPPPPVSQPAIDANLRAARGTQRRRIRQSPIASGSTIPCPRPGFDQLTRSRPKAEIGACTPGSPPDLRARGRRRATVAPWSTAVPERNCSSSGTGPAPAQGNFSDLRPHPATGDNVGHLRCGAGRPIPRPVHRPRATPEPQENGQVGVDLQPPRNHRSGRRGCSRTVKEGAGRAPKWLEAESQGDAGGSAHPREGRRRKWVTPIRATRQPRPMTRRRS